MEKKKNKYILLKNYEIIDCCIVYNLREAEKQFAQKHVLKKGFYEIYKLMLYLNVK